MITDIWVDFRESPSVVVFTEDNSLYDELKKLSKCYKAVPYVREEKMIGADIYFPLRFRKDLEKIVKNLVVK